MNMNITAAVLHLKEASRLLQRIHPELSATLLKVANIFVRTPDDRNAVSEMESISREIADGSAD